MKKNHPVTSDTTISRRSLLKVGMMMGGSLAFGIRHGWAERPPTLTLPFERGQRPLVAFPQKRPLMVMTTQPPQLETPFHVFNESIFTPNDAFFVRWHLANIPTHVDMNNFHLTIRGQVTTELSLNLETVKRDFEQVEIAAVCQCGGNSRGFFNPRVPGGQWGHGAIGNARWTGVRLRDLLEKAGIRDNAVQVRFDGLDQAVADVTPDFRKSLDVQEVSRKEVIVAHSMNGDPLPYLNGYPLRLVVPGWYASYWIKALHDIEVLNTTDEQFWMKKAYRIPADPCGCIEPGETPSSTVPISTMTIRSFITNLESDTRIPSGQSFTIKGIAFDQGHGIDQVLFSADGGKHWQQAKLGNDYGNFSFRPWEIRFAPKASKTYLLQSLAINRIGESQRWNARWNPSGYLRNVVETVVVKAV